MPVATKTQVQTRASTLELAFLVFTWDLVAWGEQGEEEPGGNGRQEAYGKRVPQVQGSGRNK